MSDELPWRDREDGRATGQPQDLVSEAYLSSTSQDAGSEEARKDGHIRGRNSRLMNYQGYESSSALLEGVRS
jgi:hypothetical protein